MIEHPSKSDIKDLKNIWGVCFHDNSSIINNFFNLVYDKERTFVWKEHGKVVSALYAIPCNNGNGIYLYALGTLPEYRKKGIMTKLILHVLDLNICDYFFLIPATKELSRFYKKLKFKISSKPLYNSSIYPENDIFEEIDKEDLLPLVETQWPYSNDSIKFQEGVIKYVLTEEDDEPILSLCKIVINNTCEGYAVFAKENNTYTLLHFGMSSLAYRIIKPVKYDEINIMTFSKRKTEIEIGGGFIPY